MLSVESILITSVARNRGPRRNADPAQDGLQHAQVELAADHRGDLQNAFSLFRESVDASRQNGLERIGDIQTPDFTGSPPLASLNHQILLIDQHSDDFLDEERIALGPRQDDL